MKNCPIRLGLQLALLTLPLTAQATTLNVFESPDLVSEYGTIDTIATLQTGAEHYNYYSVSAHPSGVPLAPLESWLWVHENTGTGEFTFGFAFNVDDDLLGADNNASLNFRIVGSDTPVYVSQSDDPGEAVESPAGSGAFVGDYWYQYNTDGIAVSGITGTDWTIIIDAVDFGNVTSWSAASGDSTHLGLALGEEYRITPKGTPDDDPVTLPSGGSTALMLALGLLGFGAVKRKLK